MERVLEPTLTQIWYAFIHDMYNMFMYTQLSLQFFYIRCLIIFNILVIFNLYFHIISWTNYWYWYWYVCVHSCHMMYMYVVPWMYVLIKIINVHLLHNSILKRSLNYLQHVCTWCTVVVLSYCTCYDIFVNVIHCCCCCWHRGRRRCCEAVPVRSRLLWVEFLLDLNDHHSSSRVLERPRFQPRFPQQHHQR